MSRYFIAVEPSAEATAEILRAQEIATGGPDPVFRAIPEDQLHLTLYFCGETDAETMARIGDAIEAKGESAVELGLFGLRKLPLPDVPRVLAAGIASEGRTLKLLQQRIHDICFALADHKENRPFSPHISFARLDKNVPANAKVVKRLVKAVGDLESVVWRCDEVLVISSELSAGGPKYEVVRRIKLV